MKPKNITKFIVVLITLLILAGTSMAGNVSKETISTIREAIKEQVKHPGFYKIKENLCCADVIFTISEDGKLIVKRINSENEALSDYLKHALPHQTLFPPYLRNSAVDFGLIYLKAAFLPGGGFFISNRSFLYLPHMKP